MDDHSLARPISVLVTADVCVITLPIGARYPTQNTIFAEGVRRGRKTQEYTDLRLAAKLGGEAARRGGFPFIDAPARVEVVLYNPTDATIDAGNIGKVEFDGLEDGGLIANDRLFRPLSLDAAPGASGPRRVVIVIWAPRGANPGRDAPPRRTRSRKPSVATPGAPGDAQAAYRQPTGGLGRLQEVLNGHRPPTPEERAEILRRAR